MFFIIILIIILISYKIISKERLYKNQLTSIEIQLNTPSLNSSSYKQRFNFEAYIETSSGNYQKLTPSIDYVINSSDVINDYQLMTSVSGNTKQITWNSDASQNQVVRDLFNNIKDKLPGYSESDYNQKLRLDIKTIYYVDTDPNNVNDLVESSILNPGPVEIGDGSIPIPSNVQNVLVEFETL